MDRSSQLATYLMGGLLIFSGMCAQVRAADRLLDWSTILPGNSTALQGGGPYVPIGWAERTDYAQAIASNMQSGYPTGLQSRELLETALDPVFTAIVTNGQRLDYLFMDMESPPYPTIDQDIAAIVSRIRNDTNGGISHARIGNFGYFAGMYTNADWFPWPWSPWADFQDRETFYINTLNVAQPALYPYSYNINHTSASINGQFFVGGASPNQRSALFWAPLETFSAARRMLPASHQLIPWITDYCYVTGYDPSTDQLPTSADNVASIQHYRLRGTDGLYTFNPVMGEAAYAALLAGAWHGLDELFNAAGALRLLNAATNFSTSKASGIEWSAAQKGNRVLGVISNLSATTQGINWASVLPPYSGFPGPAATVLALPPTSPPVAANSHVSVRYQSSSLETTTLEASDPGKTMDQQPQQPWNGPNLNASRWQITAPAGSGNPSLQAVVPTPSANNNVASWFKMATAPGFGSTDKVAYSAMLYVGSTGPTEVMFLPVNTSGTSATALVDWSQQGPALWIDDSTGSHQFYFAAISVNYPYYRALNVQPSVGHWYQVRIDVDPTAGAYGQAQVYLRDVTRGDRDFLRMTWQDITTSPAPVPNRFTSLGVSLTSSRNPSNFDGWQVTSLNNNVQLDNFSAGYAVPVSGDNFEDYLVDGTMDAQGWKGVAASRWAAQSPININGNASPLAATLASGTASLSRVWWTTAAPGFTSQDHVVYSALLYSNGNVVGFCPVNTTGADPTTYITETGPYFSLRSDAAAGFRLNGIIVNGDSYKATRVPVAGHWYEVQIVVDQTRTLPGSPSPRYGVAKAYARDATNGGDFQPLTFTDETTADTTQLTEVPLWLYDGANNNPTKWNGWEVLGYSSGIQIDGLKTYLYPFKDYSVGGAVSSQMTGPNP